MGTCAFVHTRIRMICTDRYLTCPGITQLFAPVVQLAEFHADIYFDITRGIYEVYTYSRGWAKKKEKEKKKRQLCVFITLCVLKLCFSKNGP